MKINSDERVLETEGFEQFKQQGFSIKQSARAFEVLSSNLYSNKVKAIVRELGCNAWDAHVEREKLRQKEPHNTWLASSSTTFQVTLPNTWQPMFMIRDFGIGLSNEDVLGLYTTYFGSTKEKNNDTVGAFGLGSKSPFCYTDQFTVTSFFNGNKSTYQAFISDDGAPAIALLSTEKTLEKNGIQISIPVSGKDFKAFEENVRDVFKWFTSHVPEVTGRPGLIVPVSDGMVAKTYSVYPISFFRFNNGQINFLIRQGNVVYPVDIDSFSLTTLTEAQKSLFKWGFLVDVPIGSVNVTASRERLNYDKNTEGFLVRTLDMMISEIRKDLNAEMKDIDTQWKASKFYRERIQPDSFYQSLMIGHKLPGNLKLDRSFPFELRKDVPRQVEVKDDKSPTGMSFTTVIDKVPVLEIVYRSYNRTDTITYGNFSPGDYKLVFDDAHTAHYAKKYDYIKGTLGSFWLIRKCDPKMDNASALSLICKQFGNCDPADISKFSMMSDPPKAINQTPKTRKLLKLNGARSSVHNVCTWDDATHDMGKGGYFTYTKAGTIEDLFAPVAAVGAAHRLKILDGVEVFGVPRGNRKPFDRDKQSSSNKWHPFKDYLVKKVNEFHKSEDFERIAVLRKALQNIPGEWLSFLTYMQKHNFKGPKDINQALNFLVLYRSVVDPYLAGPKKDAVNDYITLGASLRMDVGKMFPTSPNKSESDYKLSLTKDVNTLKTKYPLVALIKLPEKPSMTDIITIQSYLDFVDKNTP